MRTAETRAALAALRVDVAKANAQSRLTTRACIDLAMDDPRIPRFGVGQGAGTNAQTSPSTFVRECENEMDLRVACLLGHKDVVSDILNEPYCIYPDIYVSSVPGIEAENALSLAALNGHWRIVRALIFDRLQRTNPAQCGNALLGRVVEHSVERAVRCVDRLERGLSVDIDAEARDDDRAVRVLCELLADRRVDACANACHAVRLAAAHPNNSHILEFLLMTCAAGVVAWLTTEEEEDEPEPHRRAIFLIHCLRHVGQQERQPTRIATILSLLLIILADERRHLAASPAWSMLDGASPVLLSALLDLGPQRLDRKALAYAIPGLAAHLPPPLPLPVSVVVAPQHGSDPNPPAPLSASVRESGSRLQRCWSALKHAWRRRFREHRTN